MLIRSIALLFTVEFASAVKHLPNPVHYFKFNQWHDTGFGLDFCGIPKAGSTITGGILCDVLRDYKGISYRQHFSRTIIGENQCTKHNLYRNRFVSKWSRPLFPVKFTIIRHPIDRFVSLYGHFCDSLKICQDRDIHGFARWIYEIRKKNLILKGKIAKTLNHHAFPQSSYCNAFKEPIEIIHFTHDKRKMRREMMRVFKKAKIPTNVANKALRHVLQSTTLNSKNNSSRSQKLKRKVLANHRTLDYIQAIYHEDFKLFNKH